MEDEIAVELESLVAEGGGERRSQRRGSARGAETDRCGRRLLSRVKDAFVTLCCIFMSSRRNIGEKPSQLERKVLKSLR